MSLNANALTSLATLKDYLEIESLDTSQDARLERLINTSSQMIANYCRRVLKQASITEYHDGRNSDRILLKEYPVNSITSLNVDQGWSYDSTSLMDVGSYAILNDMEIVLNGQVFPKGQRNIKVIYSAGFSTIPSDLEQACLSLCEYLYMVANDRRIGVSAKSKNGETISFKDSIPNFVEVMLEPYVRNDFSLNISLSNL